MRLTELLTRDRVRVGLSAATVEDAALTLADALDAAGDLEEPEALRTRIREGSSRDIVDVEGGVALPHYRTTAARRLGLALGVLAEPIGETRVVVLVVAPPDASALHLQATSALARALAAPGVAASLASAGDADEVLGLLAETELGIRPHLRAGDIMRRDYPGVDADAPLRAAAECMLDGHVRAIPVVGDKGEVLGMVSSRDVLGALLPGLDREGEPSDRSHNVRDVMSRSVLCVPEDMAVTDVANMMINKHVEQVPVVREGRLVGVLARADIIRNLFAR